MRISSELRAQLLELAAANPAEEVCGLLFGSADEITSFQSARNVAICPATSFEIDPAALIAAHRAMRNDGPALIGCYHSHPNGLARPSARDHANAFDAGFLWLILAADDITAWRAGPSSFAPIPLS